MRTGALASREGRLTSTGLPARHLGFCFAVPSAALIFSHTSLSEFLIQCLVLSS